MTELIAAIPFVKGTKASQSINATFNGKSFTFLLRWNAQGFFALQVTSGTKTYMNQKLTDVAITGKDPSTYIPEFLVLPFDISVDTLDLRLMHWGSVT